MPIKFYKPTNPARRHASVADTSELSSSRPPKSLRYAKNKISGRNFQGKITVRDPGRGAYIALLHYNDGERRYIIAPAGLNVGEEIVSGKGAVTAKNGNRMPLGNIPVGLTVHAVELQSGGGAKLVRGAGLGAQLLAIEGEYAHLKLPSGEIRMVSKNASATVGIVGNSDHNLVRWGKAGRTRHRGFKPSVRGKAMNPVDHPHGGGEGKHPIGMTHPKTPWGKHALGVKTRACSKWSDALIIKRRK